MFCAVVILKPAVCCRAECCWMFSVWHLFKRQLRAGLGQADGVSRGRHGAAGDSGVPRCCWTAADGGDLLLLLLFVSSLTTCNPHWGKIFSLFSKFVRTCLQTGIDLTLFPLKFLSFFLLKIPNTCSSAWMCSARTWLASPWTSSSIIYAGCTSNDISLVLGSPGPETGRRGVRHELESDISSSLRVLPSESPPYNLRLNKYEGSPPNK